MRLRKQVTQPADSSYRTISLTHGPLNSPAILLWVSYWKH